MFIPWLIPPMPLEVSSLDYELVLRQPFINMNRIFSTTSGKQVLIHTYTFTPEKL